VIEGDPADTEMKRPRVDWRIATDADLASGFADGDDTCLEESFQRWGSLIYAVAYRALDSSSEAEDITQQVFVGAWQARASYRESRGSLPGWLLGIARHRIADRQRARGRDLRLVRAVTSDANVQVKQEPLATLIDRLVLADEIQRLPDPRGTILRMAFWEGQSYSQIAEQLELPLGTVKSHSRRALRQLRARLEEVTSWST
jgi:RNA polymerase sigma-70 factor (ECF subfamily)